MRDADSQAEAVRDLNAARAELRGRRDQASAEFDERLAQLDTLAAQLDSGELGVKIVQDRVRQLLGERGGLARAARAGRTQIGMRLPASAAAAPTAAVRAGPPPSLAGTSLRQVLAVVDSRIVQLIMSEGADEEIRLELAALGAMRTALDTHAEATPSDAVLLGTVLEYADEVQATINDLAAGGVERLRRLLAFDRELASRLLALGGSIPGIKEQLKRAREMLGADAPDLGQALAEALAAFARLKQELDRRLPPTSRSLFAALFDH